MDSDLLFVLGIVLLFNTQTFIFGLILIAFASYNRFTKTRKHDDITF